MNPMVEKLIQKGVAIPNPQSVLISDDVDSERISGDGVTIFAGCKIIGPQSLILPNCQIGYESPVTLENTLVGEHTHLKGGFFSGAVFVGRNVFGSGAHVRTGTIIEEEAGAAHTVGLKQTILFPFVTLGSLINFCDCLMAGGTSRKDHSEVGSSFIHFNYTPNQDKATPSMMGNVPQGVMLKSKPIFLGGQGGLVGPVRIGFGCLTAAGSIIRKNELRNDRLIVGAGFKEGSIPRKKGGFGRIDSIIDNNIHYIAGLVSLRHWYRHIRPLFTDGELTGHLIKGLKDTLDGCIRERIHQLEKLRLNLSAMNFQSDTIRRIESVIEYLNSEWDKDRFTEQGEIFVSTVEHHIRQVGKDYIRVIQGLEPEEQNQGSDWLYRIEQEIALPLLTKQE